MPQSDSPHDETSETNSNQNHGERAKQKKKKIRIMDLKRFDVGETVFWICFRTDTPPAFEKAKKWMKVHPWFLWRHKIYPWRPKKRKAPRTNPADAATIMVLCGQTPRIETFSITGVRRCKNLGTFLYESRDAEGNQLIMPENLIFRTKDAARKEVKRLKLVFRDWMATWQAETEDNIKEN